MENSKIELIFPNIFIFIFIFAWISQKMTYRMSQKLFSQIFMKFQISRGAFNQVGCLFTNSKYCLYNFFSLTQDKQLKKLQIYIITSSPVSSLITFISSLASSSSEGEMNGFTASLLSNNIDS